jgi:ABC-2 type transport system ATP-binding protein
MPPPDTSVLDVRGVSKAFGATQALQDVDLRVEPGEFVALLGPNGAGKSTLFQILSGLFAPDNGEVAVAGHNLRREPPKALARLGIVFQQPTLDLELSVAANLRFHARLHGLGRGETRERIAAELERFDLAERARDPARTLSGGNRRRLELARALVHRPRVLLMDEPTVGLDPQSRRDLLTHVRELCTAEGVVVLWATHLVDEAERADRVVVLTAGRIRFDGTPAEMRQRTGQEDLADALLSFGP